MGILLSDIHLSLQAPLARAGELCWQEAMRRSLDEMGALAERHHCPVFCAGDVFDRWKAEPELINFAIDTLPKMYAIPGQHDLPHHALMDIHKSAFWTLVRAGVITVPPCEGMSVGKNIWVCGFPWGVKPKPPTGREHWLTLALVHAYTWIYGSGYENAPDLAHLQHLCPEGGFKTVVIGDNHTSFDEVLHGTAFFNCGGFYRRKSDEARHKPRVGLLHPDGTVTPHFLDTSRDVFTATVLDTADPGVRSTGLDEFLTRLRALQTSPLDFNEALRKAMSHDTTPEPVRVVLREALQEAIEIP